MARPIPRGPTAPPTMSAPYRFIPLSAWVHEPEWGQEVSIDRPFEDGVSGWLDYTLTAKTPLLVGGRREAEGARTHVHFCQTPDGRYAIPGSSLRGMLRSVLEIAAFGRAAFIDDVRYGVRDLSRYARALYQERFVERVQNPATVWPDTYRSPNPVFTPKVEAGWLWKETDSGTNEERWKLRPCDFARVAVTELDSIARGREIEKKLRRRENAFERRAHWSDCPGSFATSLYVTRRKLHARVWRASQGQPYRSTAFLVYAEAFQNAQRDTPTVPTDGNLVFTGKPAEGLHIKPPRGSREERQYYGKKKHEFFFHSPDSATAVAGPTPCPVYDVTELREDFIAVHEEAPGRDGAKSWDPGKEKLGWKQIFYENTPEPTPIPVFFLRKDKAGAPSAIGLAMMFRLAHKETTHKLLKNASESHVRADVRDFPSLLFGSETAEKFTEETLPWKGRVSVETAEAVSGVEEAAPMTVVLATPRGQFFPAYVAQPTVRTQNYASYTPLKSPQIEEARPEIAGRKRYPSRLKLYLHNHGTDDMRSVLHPLAPSAKFKGRIRFHNLKPEELGALVWALELWAPSWGARPDLRHRLGMGKPLGLGDVRIDITAARMEPNEVGTDGARPEAFASLDHTRAIADAFANHMTKAFAKHSRPNANTDWRSSEQMEMLLALSDPTLADSEKKLRYMTLNPDDGLNEFRDARNDGARLPPAPRRTFHGRPPGPADRAVFSHPFSKTTAAPHEPARPAAPGGPALLPNGSRWIDVEENLPVTVLGPGPRLDLVRVRYDDGGIDTVRAKRLAKI